MINLLTNVSVASIFIFRAFFGLNSRLFCTLLFFLNMDGNDMYRVIQNGSDSDLSETDDDSGSENEIQWI